MYIYIYIVLLLVNNQTHAICPVNYHQHLYVSVCIRFKNQNNIDTIKLYIYTYFPASPSHLEHYIFPFEITKNTTNQETSC